ncbi:serine carboxypeptidase precursor [Artemisia annua]|uniref:Serine carboxypeptidase n=1 Tax=Artemisia annua TaxID=35608 RepID=A0A2U1KCS7_ARTAN|nr:serine carboxypeptidase precursor [Artemisia annua]
MKDEADFGLERLHLSAEKELQIDEEAATKDNFNDFRENMKTLLNKKFVRQPLGVGDVEFVSCSPTVYIALLMDLTRNLEAGIPELHEDGIKSLGYPREYDVICNWLG